MIDHLKHMAEVRPEGADRSAAKWSIQMYKTCSATTDLLMRHADTIDEWANQSITGGWSTHQVEGNRKVANELRSQAAILYRLLNPK